MSCRIPGCIRVCALLIIMTTTDGAGRQDARSRTYEDLLTLFREWREFQPPKLLGGIPDYTVAAMAAQHAELAKYRDRLAAIDTAGWTRARQVDWHVVRAEMNALDFDHRVLRPWANNPAFYVTVFPGRSDQPAREGPHAWGSLELWRYTFPLSAAATREVQERLRSIPGLLRQARSNLVGNGRDLWTMGVRSARGQVADLDALASRVQQDADLAAAVRAARDATDEFARWLEQQAPTKTGPSGIGVENYDWYLANVQLLPYTWQEQVTLMRRELGRARTALALEEERNRGLPPLDPIASAAEWERRFNDSVTEYVAFLRDRRVLTLRDYMEPALRARLGRFSAGPREFFTEVNHRDPIIMRTHDFHWIDLAEMEHAPHPSPVRRGPLLYNIFITRTEGLATAMEEMMMAAGLLDSHPRGRELIWILVAQRAARALGDLMMHANRWTIEEAARFAVTQTPRGWLREDGNTVWGEQHLYLQHPTYGTSYLIGKTDIERLLADRARESGAAFTLQRFMDEFLAAGMIPMSLVRFEMTGERQGF
jgi:hypothetical protein